MWFFFFSLLGFDATTLMPCFCGASLGFGGFLKCGKSPPGLTTFWQATKAQTFARQYPRLLSFDRVSMTGVEPDGPNPPAAECRVFADIPIPSHTTIYLDDLVPWSVRFLMKECERDEMRNVVMGKFFIFGNTWASFLILAPQSFFLSYLLPSTYLHPLFPLFNIQYSIPQ